MAIEWENSGATPHCDQRVLHAPGECWACDLYPNWQNARTLQGIAFTGHEPGEGEVFDPATLFRTEEQINLWPGNRPSTEHSTGWAPEPPAPSLLTRLRRRFRG